MKAQASSQSLRTHGRTPLAALSILAIALVFGCGDNGESGTGATGGGGDEPLYLVSNTVFTPDGASAFLTLVNDLDESVPIDLSEFIELPGSARAYGPPNAGVAYLTSDENGTMTEVTFDDGGTPSLGRVVSFANLGINRTSGGNVNAFFSPTKAYHVNQNTLAVVIWNPAEMTITGTIPLDLPIDQAFPNRAFLGAPLQVGNNLLLITSQYQADFISHNNTTTLTVIDVESDTVVSSAVDTRCHALLSYSRNAQGHIYLASSPISASLHYLFPEQFNAPCMLRIRDGETRFDPGFSRGLREELATPIWTGTAPGDDVFYVQRLPEDTPGLADTADAFEIDALGGWEWYSMTNGQSDPVAVSAPLEFPPLFPAFPVGDDFYVTTWDDVDTTLVRLTGDGGLTTGLVVPGFVYNVVQVL